MTIQAKKAIQTLTAERIEVAGSQNKYAQRIGVSPAVISFLRNEQWDSIGDDMWQKLALGCGYDGSSWQTATDTTAYKKVTYLLHDAKTFSTVSAYIAPAGSSKTTPTREFAQSHANVYRLTCEEHWHKKDFLVRLYQQMGFSADGLRTSDLMDKIEQYCVKQANPLIILDEVDKLNDRVLYFFITLYNRLEGQCGIFLCATDNFQKRVEKGLRTGRMGYQEIYSRINRRFIQGVKANGEDIARVCRINGLTDDRLIDEVITDSEGDLRRVKRKVHALKQRAKSEAQPQALINQQ